MRNVNGPSRLYLARNGAFSLPSFIWFFSATAQESNITKRTPLAIMHDVIKAYALEPRVTEQHRIKARIGGADFRYLVVKLREDKLEWCKRKGICHQVNYLNLYTVDVELGILSNDTMFSDEEIDVFVKMICRLLLAPDDVRHLIAINWHR
jgi:hypothetical protein